MILRMRTTASERTAGKIDGAGPAFFKHLPYDHRYKMVCDCSTCNNKECVCVFCNLVNNDVNICNVKITINKKKDTYYYQGPDEYRKYHTDFFVLISETIKREPLRSGNNYTITNPDNHYTIERLNNMTYKLCFHTIKPT